MKDILIEETEGRGDWGEKSDLELFFRGIHHWLTLSVNSWLYHTQHFIESLLITVEHGDFNLIYTHQSSFMMNLVQFLDLKGHLVCFIISSSYIISLYLIPRSVRETARDNPTHIQCRMFAASASTILSGIMCYFCFQSWNFPIGITFFEACGMRMDTALEAIYSSCLLMSIFYLGPLVTSSVYLYVSYYHGVDSSGNIGEKKGKERFSSFLAYVWDLNLRYLNTLNIMHLWIKLTLKLVIIVFSATTPRFLLFCNNLMCGIWI